MVAPIARRSRMPGRVGITIRSAARAAVSAGLSACGAVSMKAYLTPEAFAVSRAAASRAGGHATMAGVSSSRLSPQPAAEACGSRSISTTGPPALAACTARCSAIVVLPEPYGLKLKRSTRRITRHGYDCPKNRRPHGRASAVQFRLELAPILLSSFLVDRVRAGSGPVAAKRCSLTIALNRLAQFESPAR
jgi:hypothetical protein